MMRWGEFVIMWLSEALALVGMVIDRKYLEDEFEEDSCSEINMGLAQGDGLPIEG